MRKKLKRKLTCVQGKHATGERFVITNKKAKLSNFNTPIIPYTSPISCISSADSITANFYSTFNNFVSSIFIQKVLIYINY